MVTAKAKKAALHKLASTFDSGLHPRYPKGHPMGGKFMPKGSSDYKQAVTAAATTAQAKTEQQKKAGKAFNDFADIVETVGSHNATGPSVETFAKELIQDHPVLKKNFKSHHELIEAVKSQVAKKENGEEVEDFYQAHIIDAKKGKAVKSAGAEQAHLTKSKPSPPIDNAVLGRDKLPPEEVATLTRVRSSIFYGDSHFESVWKKASAPPPDEKGITGIFGYTTSRYREMNQHLRAGGDWENPKTDDEYLIAAAVHGLKQLPNYKGTTYRGTNLRPEILDQYREGMTVQERAFTSTAADESSAFGGNTIMTIRAKRGKSIGKMSEYEHEKEVLFIPGTKFKVVKRRDDPGLGKTYLELEEV